VTTKSASLGIGQLLRVLCAHDTEGRTDGQLLERFLVHQDDAAFAALVRRHGPMVFGVCRRILGNDADSEDAFQATFLVLVRRAPSLRSRSIVGDWLHGVARYTALKAKAAATHRQAKEQAMARPNATAEEVRNDWLPLLDEELARLPEKYRLPIVLCDLEGKTRHEAAEQLGWPEGTVAGRLARARTMLAKGLGRHGLVLSGGALAVALAQNAASAGVPGSLLVSTVKAATFFAAGQTVAAGAVSAKVAALTEGVVKAMLLTKLKIVATLVLTLCFLGSGATVVTYQALLPAVAGADQPAQASKPGKDKQPNKPAKTDKDKLQGTWIVVSAQFDGKPAPDEFVKSFKLVFVGDKVTVHPSDDGTEGGKDGSFTLDTKKKPKEIDFTGDDKTTKGIYTFEKEQLELAMAEIGQDRPTEFKSQAGTRHGVIVMKRAAEPEKKKQNEKDEKIALNGAGGDPQTDLARIQGSWKGIKLEVEGKSAPAELVDKGKYVFKGNKLTIFEGDKQVGEATFSLDSAKKPQTIDLTPTEGKAKGKTMYGIYRIEGDTLTLCIGEKRPTEFNGAGKAGLLQFKRDQDGEREGAGKPADADKKKLLKLDGPVTSALWSLDGKLMAVVATRQEKTKDGDKERPFDYFTTVRIHDAKTGKENVSLGELKNANQVHRLFAPDGKTLAISIRTTIQEGDKVELWDAENGQILRTIEMDYGRAQPRLAFSPDGKQLAVAFGGRTSDKVSGGARVFDTQTGDLIHSLTGHKSLVNSVCFSPDGKTLATGGDYLDREIHLWDLASGKPIQVLEGLKGSAWCVTFSPDGKTLAGSDTEGGVRLWDVKTGKEKAALPDNGGYCSLVAFTRDGRLLLGSGRVEKDVEKEREQTGVRVWDLKTGKLLLKVENASESAAFSPDDRTLSVLVRSEGIKMMNLAGLLK